jgi:hypothetical protein
MFSQSSFHKYKAALLFLFFYKAKQDILSADVSTKDALAPAAVHFISSCKNFDIWLH